MAGTGTNNDDYIRSEDEELRLGLPADEPAEDLAEEGQLDVTAAQARAAEAALRNLDWHGGLTRDEIQARYRDLPLGIYLRLPASKRYTSPEDVLHEARIAASRAEGEFMGANSDIPEAASIADGGPPGWGDASGVITPGAILEGGSAEDTEGLLPGDEPDTPSESLE